MTRRVIDIVSAAVALVLLSPVLLAIALAIRLDSPGSPVYGGWRIGKDGRRFRMWKFRSMVVDADRLGPGITARSDPRVTRVGAFLRKTKLDELPQCVNLLLGDLTLVGPRAEVPDIVDGYTPEQREVLLAKPGITGPGQLYYTTDQQDTIPEGIAADAYYVRHLLGPKLEMDIEYLRRRTVLTDLRLIVKTATVMLGGLARASVERGNSYPKEPNGNGIGVR